MATSRTLISSAILRTQHFQKSISWFEDALQNHESFADVFEELVKKISLCDIKEKHPSQVIFMGVGKSADVSKLASNMLASVGILSRFVHATEAFHGELGIVRPKDVVIIVSNSGRSAEVLTLLPFLKMRKAELFAITAKPHSPFGKEIENILLIPNVSEMCPVAQSPLTSTITTLTLFQLLTAASIEFRKYTVNDYALNHPGGGIGKKIFIKVDDLMACGKNLPAVTQDLSFTELVSQITLYSKGSVIVTDDEGKMCGLITEKDLRVAMKTHKKQVFDLCSKDLMNPKPYYLTQGTLAVDALKFMSQQNPPLSVLPILDDAGKALGMLHILDLIQANIAVEEGGGTH